MIRIILLITLGLVGLTVCSKKSGLDFSEECPVSLTSDLGTFADPVRVCRGFND